MKIGIDIREVAGRRAGKGYYVFELVNYLAKIDAKNEYLLYTKELFDWDLPKNFQMIQVSGKSVLWHRNLGKRLVADKADVFLASLSCLSVIFAKIPTVLVVFDLAVFYAPVKSKRRAVVTEHLTMKRGARKADRILAISEATRSELLRFDKTLKDKITVTPLAASDRFIVRPTKEIVPTLKKYQLDSGYVLSVGTLEPRKNYPLLIRAYAKLPVGLQQKHPLVIVGKKGWYYKEIFKLANELNIKDVAFLDYASNDDLPMIYNGAAVFVYPSVYEGFGMPVLEAIKSGVPTIINDTPAVVEIGGGASLVIKGNSDSDLAAKIEKVVSDKNYAGKLSSEGLDYVKRYDWQETARLTLNALEATAKAKYQKSRD